MTDQTSGYFCIITMTENFILQFLLLTLSSCMLTYITVYKLLSLFLELNVCDVRIYINESVQRDVYKCCVAVWILSARQSQRYRRRSAVYASRYRRILDVSEFWIRRSRAALGAPSVFGFLKNMPTKMILWTRVIYTSWNWGWKSLDTLGSRLGFEQKFSKCLKNRSNICSGPSKNFEPRN